mgnify:CR=1 FL=1
MVSLYRNLWLLLWLSVSLPAWAVDIQTKLDANEVSMGDTVELTVTVDEQAFNSSPDFSPLNQYFEILGKRQSSQYSMINGRISSTTSWILTLLPKQEGYIAVPSLEYGDGKSKPLKLHVIKRKDVDPKDTNQLLFLDASVDKNSVYVQEQLIYTIRVFWSGVELYDSSFSPPEIGNAVMEQLGDRRKYHSTINGRSYEVIEFRYAVFPQKSGKITISPAELMATVYRSRRGGFGRDPFNGKQVRRISPEIELDVKAKPKSYPADKPWLPARSLQLKESWSPDSSQVKVSEPITRRVVLEADGLVETILPPIPVPKIQGLKIYPEPAETSSNVGSRGIISKRVESQAIIATQPGPTTLPSIEVTWWDVEEETLKVTSLPQRNITVTGAASNLQADPLPQIQPPPSFSSDLAPPPLQPVEQSSTAWQWIAIISLGLWLVTLGGFGWFYYQSKFTVARLEEDTPQDNLSRAGLKLARNTLRTACETGDPRQTRHALIELFRQHWQDDSIKNLDHIAKRVQLDSLSNDFKELERSLYKDNQQSSRWQPGNLQEHVEQALSNINQGPAEKSLQPLYPT